MATAAAIRHDDAIVIVHEPSQRYVAVGFALCDDAERALHFTDEHAAETVIARHASEPAYVVQSLREALAA
jgi:hypothetical protein